MRQTNEIADCVRRSLERYFKDLDGAKPRAIYDMVLKNVERPMLELVLDRAEGNQSIAAQMLGINRNTLRKKIHPLRIKMWKVIPIRTALVSVSDKSGLAEFARGLARFKIKILSTGGTAKLLAPQGLPVTEAADYTGFPEMLDGRVKTLHPRLHAGILARGDSPAHP